MAEERQRVRLFVAVTVPAALLHAVAELTDDLRPRFPGARWTESANQHVTLKFLGWTNDDDVVAVHEACKAVAQRHAAATLSLGELGAFPSRKRVRVLWVGIEDPSGLLASVAGDLDDVLEPLGFEAEQRAFAAHLTLARLRAPLRMAGDWPAPPLPRSPWSCHELTLFRSHLSPRGARYEALGTFPLAHRTTGGA